MEFNLFMGTSTFDLHLLKQKRLIFCMISWDNFQNDFYVHKYHQQKSNLININIITNMDNRNL